jgi:4-diphosphocytidyl-2-C-methyl-D-erythritol kinase
MPVITELARAKVNLTLEVRGRRPDGYHELASLVGFAAVSDVVSLDTDAHEATVTVSGPFAHAVVGENLIATTLQRLAQGYPALKLGAVHLDKRLPVAAGIGGGSADAAAVLRAVQRANARAASVSVPWHEIAVGLGADVPVCHANTTCWITGIGDRLHPLVGLPKLHALLVNTLDPVPPDKTAQVFRALAASAVTVSLADQPLPPPLDRLRDGTPDHVRDGVLAFLRARGNGLETATQCVVPGVGDALTALRSIKVVSGAKIAHPAFVAMSGAGPTCFAIYEDASIVCRAAEILRREHPGWWVVATQIGEG